mmetsp:Transcript_76991/g.89498  ORF Transcript_76991/g.89498 Transcript_76991/m.89498 type:complete len:229 (-) Transcript_76991:759-1445(-)
MVDTLAITNVTKPISPTVRMSVGGAVNVTDVCFFILEFRTRTLSPGNAANTIASQYFSVDVVSGRETLSSWAIFFRGPSLRFVRTLRNPIATMRSHISTTDALSFGSPRTGPRLTLSSSGREFKKSILAAVGSGLVCTCVVTASIILCLSINTHAFSQPSRTAVFTICAMQSSDEEEGFIFTLADSEIFFKDSPEMGFIKAVRCATASTSSDGPGVLTGISSSSSLEF